MVKQIPKSFYSKTNWHIEVDNQMVKKICSISKKIDVARISTKNILMDRNFFYNISKIFYEKTFCEYSDNDYIEKYIKKDKCIIKINYLFYMIIKQPDNLFDYFKNNIEIDLEYFICFLNIYLLFIVDKFLNFNILNLDE
jgi:hypothetical protein